MTQPGTHQDLDAERALLGAALTNPNTATDLNITADMFADARHGWIWSAINRRAAVNEPTDPVVIANDLAKLGQLARLPDGAAYLHTCMHACPSPSHAGHYAAIITEHHNTRTLLAQAERLRNAATVTDPTKRAQLARDALNAGRLTLPDAPTPDTATVSADAILRGLLDHPDQAVWGEPEDLIVTSEQPGPFPVHVLPPDLADYVTAVAATTQTPTDMGAMLVLSCLATVAANRWWIAREADWVEPLILWTLVALPPGSRKSAVASHAGRPLYAIERELRDQHKQDAAGKEDLLAIATKRKERIFADLIKVRNPRERMSLEADLEAVRAEIDELTVPPAQQLLCDDVTPEALGVLLSENDGHIGIISTEGGVFANLTGRYTQGTPQLDLILKSYDGDPYRANRVGRAKVLIDHPAVAFGLAVQPHVLAETTRTPALRERGLMGRFSYAVPLDTVGTRDVVTPAMSEAAEARWRATLRRLVALPVCDPATYRRTLWLDVDALALHREYQAAMEPRLHELTGDLGFMADWAGKHVGRILRVAGLLHIANGGEEDEAVNVKTMQAALDIGDWMLAHACSVYGGWRAPAIHEGAAAVLAWTRRTRSSEVTSEQVRAALRGQRWCTNVDAVRSALVTLVRTGWFISVRRLRADGKRNGKGAFIPHPDLLKD
jgi:replicative DNA helicase